MARYLFIASLAMVGGYAWGNIDGLAVGIHMAPVVHGHLSPY